MDSVLPVESVDEYPAPSDRPSSSSSTRPTGLFSVDNVKHTGSQAAQTVTTLGVDTARYPHTVRAFSGSHIILMVDRVQQNAGAQELQVCGTSCLPSAVWHRLLAAIALMFLHRGDCGQTM